MNKGCKVKLKIDAKQLDKFLGNVGLFERIKIRPNPLVILREVKSSKMRQLFDASLDLIHYAGSCQRVGRCMRLAIYADGVWVGGIVLGSTFPNILVRDEALGLRCFVTDYKKRGLKNPWSGENKEYWKALQKIVNHARTFIFPQYQYMGLGIKAHRVLLKEGMELWQEKYKCEVNGLDTLCTHPNSKLFLNNNWKLVGRTKGYTSDPSKVFSTTAFQGEWKNIIHNVGLRKIKDENRWWVWVRKL